MDLTIFNWIDNCNANSTCLALVFLEFRIFGSCVILMTSICSPGTNSTSVLLRLIHAILICEKNNSLVTNKTILCGMINTYTLFTTTRTCDPCFKEVLTIPTDNIMLLCGLWVSVRIRNGLCFIIPFILTFYMILVLDMMAWRSVWRKNKRWSRARMTTISG